MWWESRETLHVIMPSPTWYDVIIKPNNRRSCTVINLSPRRVYRYKFCMLCEVGHDAFAALVMIKVLKVQTFR